MTGDHHTGRLKRLKERLSKHHDSGQIRFSLKRYSRLIQFSIRHKNEADYRIAGELVMGEYQFDPSTHYEHIIDGGANIGMFSVQAAATNPQAEITAYEPSPENLDQYRINCSTNSITPQIYEAALWSHDTTVKFQNDTSMSGHVDESKGGVEVTAICPQIKKTPG